MLQSMEFGTKIEGGVYVGQVQGHGLIISPNAYESEVRWKITHLDGEVSYPAKRVMGELVVDGHQGWTLPTREELEHLGMVNHQLDQEYWFCPVEFWSGELCEKGDDLAWCYDFHMGQALPKNMEVKMLVRGVKRIAG
jgi:hypothetical protein